MTVNMKWLAVTLPVAVLLGVFVGSGEGPWGPFALLAIAVAWTMIALQVKV